MSLLKGLPVEHFRVILVDAPWDFKANSVSKPGRNPRRHYDVMSLEDIAALPVKQVAADDCLLWFWITGPFLARGAHLPIFEAGGFEPSGMGFVWVKLNPTAPQLIFTQQDVAMGPGMTTRKNAEFCLLGRRGSVPRLDAGIHEVIISPRREHSRKPDETHERIERYCDGPRLELFGRQSRPGWVVRGNESSKFDPPVIPPRGLSVCVACGHEFGGAGMFCSSACAARQEALPLDVPLEPSTAPSEQAVVSRSPDPGPDPIALLAKLRAGVGKVKGIPRLTAEVADGE
jgi:N6-adenosine-specific RNA methylase IME4